MTKRIREPKLVRPHEESTTSLRAGFVMLALLLIGGLMYIYKDDVPAVADLPSGTTSMSQPSTTGSAPSR